MIFIGLDILFYILIKNVTSEEKIIFTILLPFNPYFRVNRNNFQ